MLLTAGSLSFLSHQPLTQSRKEAETTKYLSSTDTANILTEAVILTERATTLFPLSLLTIQRIPSPLMGL